MVGHPFAAAAAGLLVQLLSAQAVSIWSCGEAGDVFQVDELSVSPDPILRRKKFTITVTGKLGKAFSGGAVSYDVNVKVGILGIKVDESVKNTSQIELAPVVPAGEVKIVVGPLELPSLPGNLELSGRISVVDEAGAAVACVAMDLHTPLASDAAQVDRPREEPEGLQDRTSCAKPGDHLTNMTHTEGKDGWDVTTFTLDEAITQVDVFALLKVFVGRIPLTIKLDVPVLYEPGFPKGVFRARTKQGAPSAQIAPPRRALDGPPPVHVVGDVVVNDGTGEEVTCIHVDTSPGMGNAPTTAEEQAIVV